MNSNTTSHLIALKQAAASELGDQHPLVRYINIDNALLALSSAAHSGLQVEFDYVMAFICTHPAATAPPGGLFAIFCTDKKLVRRCIRWMITELNNPRTVGTDDDSATTQPLGDSI